MVWRAMTKARQLSVSCFLHNFFVLTMTSISFRLKQKRLFLFLWMFAVCWTSTKNQPFLSPTAFCMPPQKLALVNWATIRLPTSCKGAAQQSKTLVRLAKKESVQQSSWLTKVSFNFQIKFNTPISTIEISISISCFHFLKNYFKKSSWNIKLFVAICKSSPWNRFEENTPIRIELHFLLFFLFNLKVLEFPIGQILVKRLLLMLLALATNRKSNKCVRWRPLLLALLLSMES